MDPNLILGIGIGLAFTIATNRITVAYNRYQLRRSHQSTELAGCRRGAGLPAEALGAVRERLDANRPPA